MEPAYRSKINSVRRPNRQPREDGRIELPAIPRIPGVLAVPVDWVRAIQGRTSSNDRGGRTFGAMLVV